MRKKTRIAVVLLALFMLIQYALPAAAAGVSLTDLRKVALYITGKSQPTPDAVARFDRNGNGALDVTDLVLLSRELVMPPASAASESWCFVRNANGQPPRGAWTQEALRPYGAYYLGDTSRKVIYLAFDTGYENGNTARILDVLQANGVHAAFFVTNDFLKQSPDLAMRMAAEGHVVGNHTTTHPDMTKVSLNQFISELDTCAARYQSITGKPVDPFFRPPAGVFSRELMVRAQNLGYTTIFWSLAYKDWITTAQPSVNQAYKHIVNDAHPGCITLLHTVSSANAGALDSAIKTLRAQGYTFESLYDLP